MPLTHYDIHSDNLMYDELAQQIEIVDGSAAEKNKNTSNYIRSKFLKTNILLKLEQIAADGIPYTQEVDHYLLNTADIKKRAHEFSDLHDLYNSHLFLSTLAGYEVKAHLDAWRNKNYLSFFKNQTNMKLSSEEKAQLFLKSEQKPDEMGHLNLALQRLSDTLYRMKDSIQKRNNAPLMGLGVVTLSLQEKERLLLKLKQEPADSESMAATLEGIVQERISFSEYWDNFRSITLVTLLTAEEIKSLFSELKRNTTDFEHEKAVLQQIVKARRHDFDIVSAEEKADKIIHRSFPSR